MENAYGIGITNRYALFIDEDEEGRDPIDILKQAEVAEKKVKKVDVVKPNAKAPVKKEALKDSNGKICLNFIIRTLRLNHSIGYLVPPPLPSFLYLHPPCFSG